MSTSLNQDDVPVLLIAAVFSLRKNVGCYFYGITATPRDFLFRFLSFERAREQRVRRHPHLLREDASHSSIAAAHHQRHRNGHEHQVNLWARKVQCPWLYSVGGAAINT
jgi:hypothetical protein